MSEPAAAAAIDAPHWAAGDNVGRYTLLAKIALGGMAEIWLARQAGPRGFEKVVVIKRILDSFSQDPEFVEMFLDEARIAAQLNHPNIVQIFDLGEHGHAWYIAMEYVAGENLAAVMRASVNTRRPVPVRIAMRLISNACEGLGYAHTKAGVDNKPLKIVHRDVSPQNLIVTYDGQLKVVDFGIAKAASRGSQTAGGQIKGKFAYMAPEQAAGEELDGRADVFALGVIAYEMATRQRLFKADDDMRVLSMVLSPEPVLAANERNPEVPAALAQVLARALEKNPAARFEDARSFQRGLDEWLASQGTQLADVGAMMQGLFADRMKSRLTLIETASRGELTPSGAEAALRIDTGRSMPGANPPPMPSLLRRHWALWLGGLLSLAVLAAIVTATWSTPATPRAEPTALAPAQVEIDTEPTGAMISLDGHEAGRSPLRLADISPGQHQIQASLAGRQPVSRTITATGGEHSTVLLSLPAAVVQPVAPPAPLEPAPVRSAVVRPVQKGKLTLNTTPWTRVSLKGKPLGDTPLIELTLPAGKHQLKLVNDEKHIDKTIEVEVLPGQTTTKKLKF